MLFNIYTHAIVIDVFLRMLIKSEVREKLYVVHHDTGWDALWN